MHEKQMYQLDRMKSKSTRDSSVVIGWQGKLKEHEILMKHLDNKEN